MAVVIQTAHQPWIDLEGNPQGGQPSLHLRKTFTTAITDRIRQGWRLLQQRLSVFVFGIQDAQRIGAQPRLGIGIESFRPLLEPSHQGSAVGLAILRRAKAVQLQLQATHAEAGQQIPGQGDHLNITPGPLGTKPLHPDLMELPLPTRLGSLVAKHRTRIPELLGALTEQAML